MERVITYILVPSQRNQAAPRLKREVRQRATISLKMPDLFANFEVGQEPRWPVVLRLLVASVALHSFGAATVLYVPVVRDSLNIAMLAGKAGYVDKAYNKLKIGDDVSLLQLEKFHYPPGYFALEGAGSQAPSMTIDPLTPKIVSQAVATNIAPSPSPSPTANPSVSPSPAAVAAQAASPTPGAAKATNTPDDQKKNSEIDKQLDRIAAENDVVRPD